MKIKLLSILLGIIVIGGCFWLFFYNTVNNDNNSNNNLKKDEDSNMESKEEILINIKINDKVYEAPLENNMTTKELVKLFPMTVTMIDHLSNEKFYDLHLSLPTNSHVPSKINAGDLMLYGSKTLVLFYETFTTTYSYTKLGHIDNLSGLKEELGSGNIKVTFELSTLR